MTDLHQELAVLRELQDHVVVEAASAGDLCLVATPSRAPAVAPNPHVAFVIDRDSVIRGWPIVTFSGPAPAPDEISFLIELQNGRSSRAALRYGRVRRGVQFAALERALPMNDPDVVLTVDRHADGHAEEPVIRQRLRPKGIDFKHRRLNSGSLNS